jgi:hypothetical protein
MVASVCNTGTEPGTNIVNVYGVTVGTDVNEIDLVDVPTVTTLPKIEDTKVIKAVDVERTITLVDRYVTAPKLDTTYL